MQPGATLCVLDASFLASLEDDATAQAALSPAAGPLLLAVDPAAPSPESGLPPLVQRACDAAAGRDASLQPRNALLDVCLLYTSPSPRD